VDLALLPVNGRDAVRAAAGIAGNFSLDEAAALAREAGFRACLGHHYGMFDFNTIDPEEAEARIARLGLPSFRLARLDTRYSVDAPRGRG
jgi:L-ascorbate metabolism protein UlaG (beta-lactamase superfamily)